MSKDYIVTIKLKNEETIETAATINFINMLTAVTELCKEKNYTNYIIELKDRDINAVDILNFEYKKIG
ncbi:hypothetical protein [Gemella morbillorum]|uniref:hypothetical protein n=1 Tax=Gemella morbillorum TaxID=29391 RepID=UPI00319DC45E